MGTAATVTCQVPMTLTSKMRRHTSGVAASRSPWGMTWVVPALLTSTSSRPWRAIDLLDQMAGPGLVGHVGLDVAGGGQFGGQGLAGLDRGRRVDDHGGPGAANRRAVAAPIPDEEPVTSTVRPRKASSRDGAEWTAEVGHGPSVGPRVP